MKTKLILVSLLMFFCTFNVFAGENISQIEVNDIVTGWGTEGVYVDVSDTNGLSNKCGENRFFIRPDHPFLKIIIAQLLSALHGGNKIDVYIEGCSGKAMNLQAVAIFKK